MQMAGDSPQYSILERDACGESPLAFWQKETKEKKAADPIAKKMRNILVLL